MASGTVAVRLPKEVLEELQQKAAKKNKKVSDLVRELIVSGLAKTEGKDQGDAGTEIMARLEKLEKLLGKRLRRKRKATCNPYCGLH